MSVGNEKVNLLDAVPVRGGHIMTKWEGECAVLSFPRFKREWMRRCFLFKGMPADIRVTLEEHNRRMASDRRATNGEGNYYPACRAFWA